MADAIIRTQAMLASTIAEYYVEEQQIRLELEIGVGDLDAFRNLVPEEIYQKLGHPPRAFAERLTDFYKRLSWLSSSGGFFHPTDDCRAEETTSGGASLDGGWRRWPTPSGCSV